MKNKGFTLVELLAVIVILAVISIITIPLIGNVIKDSKKKALETSVYGLVEAANYFAISNEGRYGFLFNETSKGKTEDGEYSLSYKGEIDAEGELYIDNNGDISLCLKNEDYYVYKNYNSGIYVGNISEDSCTVKFDPLTNKYIAYLESEGEGINVYTKEEVNNLIASVNTNVTNNTNEITSIKESITNLQTDISNYALNSDLNSLSSVVNSNTESINDIKNNLEKDYIILTLESNTYSSTGSYIDIPLKLVRKSGNKIILNNNGTVSFDDTVSTVKITATLNSAASKGGTQFNYNMLGGITLSTASTASSFESSSFANIINVISDQEYALRLYIYTSGSTLTTTVYSNIMIEVLE